MDRNHVLVRWEWSSACYSQPAGSDTASLDTSFNASGTTPGIVTISTPNGNNTPTLYGCSVGDEGAGNSGAILVGGVDDGSSSSLILAGKISSFGGHDTVFGANGVVEYPVDSVDGSGPSAELTNVSLSGAHSDFGDVILSGFSFTKGTQDDASAQAPALTVALIDRAGALDPNFNGTGQLINPNYGEAVLAQVKSTHLGTNDGTATDLDIVSGPSASGPPRTCSSVVVNGHLRPVATLPDCGFFRSLRPLSGPL